jgi:O6-methylguanine-DNA--protein-cysteine methyltransferase
MFDISQLADRATERRLRDRYVSTRFPQFGEPRESLRHTGNVLRWARQLIEDEQPRLARELLQLAIEEDPTQRSVWLALIELAFLDGDVPKFDELATAFEKRFMRDEALRIIHAMGHDLSPLDTRYAAVAGEEAGGIEIPNWSVVEIPNRDENFQRRFHDAISDVIGAHSGRPT